MIRKTLLTFWLLLSIKMLSAQTGLPTSWDFSGNTPNGWTENNVGRYTSTQFSYNNTPPSGRFDETGANLVVHYSGEAGSLSFLMRGATSGTPWQGTFDVQESQDGQSWDNVSSYNSMETQSWDAKELQLSTDSRYIRFYFTEKVPGSNVGLDQVMIAEAPAGEEAVFNLSKDNNPIFNQSTWIVGNQANTTFTIANTGLVDTLFINGASITGDAAADYQVNSLPDFVLPESQSNFELIFNPADNGSRLANLSIQSSDPSSERNPFEISLYGIGGDFADEPNSQPTNLRFSNVRQWTFNVDFEPTDAEAYLVLWQKDADVTEEPENGTTYKRGDHIGEAQVTHVGSLSEFTPTYVIANSTYYFKVFAFNGPEGFEAYNTSNPLSGMQTTPGLEIGNYYQDLDVNDEDFVTNLHEIVYPHTALFYSDYTTTIVPDLDARDTADGLKVVDCALSGERWVYDVFNWDVMSREHTYPHSWYPTNPAQELEEYTDFHNLLIANMNLANGPRSNYPMGEVSGNISFQHKDGKLGLNEEGVIVYEPRDDKKGDVARAILYMCIAYNGISGNDWSLPARPDFNFVDQDQEVLKKWHYQDLPDEYEFARNEYIFSVQGNRNPLIDSVHFVDYIDFKTMEYISEDDDETALEEWIPEVFRVYPNPAQSFLNVELQSKEPGNYQMMLLNGQGQKVEVKTWQIHNSTRKETLALDQLPSGLYHLILVHPEGKVATKRVVLH